MPKPHNIYDAIDALIGATADGQAAILSVPTTDTIDLSIVMSRAILVRLRSQIDALLSQVAPPSVP